MHHLEQLFQITPFSLKIQSRSELKNETRINLVQVGSLRFISLFHLGDYEVAVDESVIFFYPIKQSEKIFKIWLFFHTQMKEYSFLLLERS